MLTLAGCGSASRQRLATAEDIASPAGLSLAWVDTGTFVLASFSRIADPSAPLVVYIEGDGLAWLSRTRLSSDPTPRSPLGLRLAALDPRPNILYLGRPCQYAGVGSNPLCGPAMWSDARFSDAVVVATARAIDQALTGALLRGVELVGYSGGGAVAALVAARRTDVASLTTVAGNLDIEAFTRHHDVSPLTGSLNPADAAANLAGLPQRHWVGGADDVMPVAIAESYAAQARDRRCIDIRVLPEATHGSGWPDNWPAMLRLPPACPAVPGR